MSNCGGFKIGRMSSYKYSALRILAHPSAYDRLLRRLSLLAGVRFSASGLGVRATHLRSFCSTTFHTHSLTHSHKHPAQRREEAKKKERRSSGNLPIFTRFPIPQRSWLPIEPEKPHTPASQTSSTDAQSPTIWHRTPHKQRSVQIVLPIDCVGTTSSISITSIQQAAAKNHDPQGIHSGGR